MDPIKLNKSVGANNKGLRNNMQMRVI